MVSDTPVEDPDGDFFDYDIYARALAELIDSEGTDTPLTLAVSAPWGAGKTSVSMMIESYLRDWSLQRDGLRSTITCWFPAWMHNDAPHLGAAMAAAVANQVNPSRPLWRRIWRPIPSAMLDPRQRWARRVKIGLVTLVIAGAALLVEPIRTLFDPLNDEFSEVISGGSIVALLAFFVATWNRVRSAADSVLAFVDDPTSEAARGTMVEVRAHLRDHIAEASRDGRLVVFVDDLERCSPARAMEVCEVANQLLDLNEVVTVFVADMRAIAAAAANQFAEEGERTDAEATDEAGRRYLEKIVQIELSLPPPSRDGIVRLLNNERAKRSSEQEEVEVDGTLMGNLPRVVRAQPVASGIGFALGTMIGVLLILMAGFDDEDVGVIVFNLVLSAPGFGIWTAVGLAYVVRWLRMQYARSQREAINGYIQNLRQKQVDESELEAEVVKEFTGRREELARNLLRSYLFDNPVQLEEVEEVIREYPPALPRRAKRILNQARLLTRIARDRNLFKDDPPLRPKQLGEWIVLQDRWPKLAEAVTREPDLLASLEFTAGQGEDAITAALSNAGIAAQSVDDLTRLLREDPRLTDVIERLVHFEPVAPPAPLPLSAQADARRQAALRAAVGISESQASLG